MLTSYDRLLIYTLLVVGLLTLPATIYLAGADTGQREVTVTASGKVVKSFTLPQTLAYYQIPGSARACALQIEGEKVRIVESDCPRGLCLAQGWISKPGQTIVCLPHRVVVKISGRSSRGPDAVTK